MMARLSRGVKRFYPVLMMIFIFGTFVCCLKIGFLLGQTIGNKMAEPSSPAEFGLDLENELRESDVPPRRSLQHQP